MATPEYPSLNEQRSRPEKRGRPTFLVLWETEVNIPAWNQDHVVAEVFPLDLGFLHNNDVCLKDVEHGLGEVSTWLAALPRVDSSHTWNVRFSRHGWYPNGFRMPLTKECQIQGHGGRNWSFSPFHVVIRNGIVMLYSVRWWRGSAEGFSTRCGTGQGTM